ncbi:MAG: hypothetical protein ACOYO9_06145 [Candidatus Nanopelagicales bacterium]
MSEEAVSAPASQDPNDDRKDDDAGFEVRDHRDHPGHRRHRLGHPVDEQVKVVAHRYHQAMILGANGSGLVAVVAWRQYLEGRAEQGAAATSQRLRGLIHR